MKTTAIVATTLLLCAASLLGYACALDSGFEFIAYYVQGYAGAALFPGIVAFCIATGHLLAVAS